MAYITYDNSTKDAKGVDLHALEDLIADAGNTMGDVAALLNVSESFIYSRKDRDDGFRRAYLRGMLRREAACIESNGSRPDDLVLRAIELGFATRRELKDALGFGYDVIEKCIERSSGDIRFVQQGQIERLELPQPLDADGELPTPKPPERVCVECGGPRSAYSAARCQKCYRKSTRMSPPVTEAAEKCGCGRDSKHGGRCWYRRQETPSLYDRLHPTTPRPVLVEPVRDSFCTANCDPDAVGHHFQCSWWNTEEGIKRSQELAEEGADVSQIGQTTALQKIVSSVPSALLKQAAWDDEFFPNAYDTLIALLDDDMSDAEKTAVWTLILYLKRIQAAAQDATGG